MLPLQGIRILAIESYGAGRVFNEQRCNDHQVQRDKHNQECVIFHSDGRLQRAQSAFACLTNSVVIADTSADIHRFASGSHTTSHPRAESIAIASPTNPLTAKMSP